MSNTLPLTLLACRPHTLNSTYMQILPDALPIRFLIPSSFQGLSWNNHQAAQLCQGYAVGTSQ